jgi:hypothetical protein
LVCHPLARFAVLLLGFAHFIITTTTVSSSSFAVWDARVRRSRRSLFEERTRTREFLDAKEMRTLLFRVLHSSIETLNVGEKLPSKSTKRRTE